ncbi:hypothetical protein [uncultured Roseibium sp.]|uniref:hypothetical protein n=1 Tax=uncultured Roseibium sp. TaxID=1936171 RepID=UPI003217627F
MRKGYIVIFVSILVLGGHLGLLPMIFFYASRFEMADKLDTAFVIGPITAAYFITISKFVIDSRDVTDRHRREGQRALCDLLDRHFVFLRTLDLHRHLDDAESNDRRYIVCQAQRRSH